MIIRFLLILAVASLSVSDSKAFVATSNRATSHQQLSPTTTTRSISDSALWAKKKKKKSTGKGFGKVTETKKPPASTKSANQDLFNIDARAAESEQQRQQGNVFSSIDMTSSSTSSSLSSSDNIEDRTGSILREKYGLRTREEQEAAEAKQKKIADQQKQLADWKRLADQGEDFDLLKVVPAPILIFIDGFLKIGVGVCTVLFVLAGIAITFEAGSKATNNPLPPSVDAFIANVVEPNFTPGLVVLLSFSVGLGAFAALQLNSAASTYREE